MPAYHLESDQQYSIEPEASSSTLSVLNFSEAIVEKLSENSYSVLIKRTANNESVNFLFNLSDKSVTSQSVLFPVCFDSFNFAQMSSDDFQLESGSRDDSESNDLACGETLRNPELEWSLMIEDMTEEILGRFLKEHDYDSLPWKIGLRHLYFECLLAISAFNKFQALAQNDTVDVESVSALEVSLNKQRNESYTNLDSVKNIATIEKDSVAVLLASEVGAYFGYG